MFIDPVELAGQIDRSADRIVDLQMQQLGAGASLEEMADDLYLEEESDQIRSLMALPEAVQAIAHMTKETRFFLLGALEDDPRFEHVREALSHSL